MISQSQLLCSPDGDSMPIPAALMAAYLPLAPSVVPYDTMSFDSHSGCWVLLRQASLHCKYRRLSMLDKCSLLATFLAILRLTCSEPAGTSHLLKSIKNDASSSVPLPLCAECRAAGVTILTSPDGHLRIKVLARCQQMKHPCIGLIQSGLV